jgi:L-threonylcarbamoyladenylate synthase
MLIIDQQDKNAAFIAAEKLRQGKIICFATETVYALACDSENENAVKELYKIKGRNLENPISIWTKNIQTAEKILQFNDDEKKIAKNFFPGEITLILKKKANHNSRKISNLLNNGQLELGLRIPNHNFSLALLNEFSGVIAATSANISGQNAATDFNCALQYFDKKIDLIIDGKTCKHKIASTVFKVNKKNIQIIRLGLITKKQIEAIINEKTN